MPSRGRPGKIKAPGILEVAVLLPYIYSSPINLDQHTPKLR